jgi:hypothetical protein
LVIPFWECKYTTKSQIPKSHCAFMQKKPPTLKGRAAGKYTSGITSLTLRHQSPWTSSRQSSH